MENEENKKVCCERKSMCCDSKEGCCHKMTNCCHGWNKCHMIRRIVFIILIIMTFCIGSQWGEMKSESKNNRFERGGMMNWDEDRFENRFSNNEKRVVDEVTVEVNKTPETPKQ